MKNLILHQGPICIKTAFPAGKWHPQQDLRNRKAFVEAQVTALFSQAQQEAGDRALFSLHSSTTLSRKKGVLQIAQRCCFALESFDSAQVGELVAVENNRSIAGESCCPRNFSEAVELSFAGGKAIFLWRRMK